MHKLTLVFFCFVLLSLSGCSSTTRTYIDTLKLAYNPGEDVALSREQLAFRDGDAMYATVGSLPRAVLALAFIENGSEKWISADQAMLVLETGRLVKTTGFSNDLLYMSDTDKDPLKQHMTKIQIGQQWQSYTDWSVKQETGYITHFEIIETAVDKITVLEQQFDTKLVTERVTFFNGDTAINRFWFELNSGLLIKSKQQIAPFWQVVDLTHISAAGRLAGIVPQRKSK